MKIVVKNISHVHKGRLIFVGSVKKVTDITFPKTEPLLFRENELFKRRIYRNDMWIWWIVLNFFIRSCRFQKVYERIKTCSGRGFIVLRESYYECLHNNAWRHKFLIDFSNLYRYKFFSNLRIFYFIYHLELT